MEKLKGREPSVSAEVIQQIYELHDTGFYGYKRIAKMLNLTKGQALYYVRKRKAQAKENPDAKEQI